jgi:hypothetical protein
MYIVLLLRQSCLNTWPVNFPLQVKNKPNDATTFLALFLKLAWSGTHTPLLNIQPLPNTRLAVSTSPLLNICTIQPLHTTRPLVGLLLHYFTSYSRQPLPFVVQPPSAIQISWLKELINISCGFQSNWKTLYKMYSKYGNFYIQKNIIFKPTQYSTISRQILIISQ